MHKNLPHLLINSDHKLYWFAALAALIISSWCR
jgi:hypothetical protein